MTTPITTTTELEALPAETLLRSGQPGYGPAYILIWDAGDGRLLYTDCTERGYLEPAEVIRFHAPLTVVSPLPAPTVKPGREEVGEVIAGHFDHGTVGDWYDPGGRVRKCSCGWEQTYPGRYDHGRGLWIDHATDAVLAILPGKTEQEVRAEAWGEGYWQGIDDARTADELQLDVGLGHGIYAQPARENPYRADGEAGK